MIYNKIKNKNCETNTKAASIFFVFILDNFIIMVKSKAIIHHAIKFFNGAGKKRNKSSFQYHISIKGAIFSKTISYKSIREGARIIWIKNLFESLSDIAILVYDRKSQFTPIIKGVPRIFGPSASP